jgi:hypothetical protein
MAIEGRCMRWKEQKPMKNARMTITARGGMMAKGECSKCGCGMCRILSKADADKAVASGEAKKAAFFGFPSVEKGFLIFWLSL